MGKLRTGARHSGWAWDNQIKNKFCHLKTMSEIFCYSRLDFERQINVERSILISKGPLILVQVVIIYLNFVWHNNYTKISLNFNHGECLNFSISFVNDVESGHLEWCWPHLGVSQPQNSLFYKFLKKLEYIEIAIVPSRCRCVFFPK